MCCDCNPAEFPRTVTRTLACPIELARKLMAASGIHGLLSELLPRPFLALLAVGVSERRWHGGYH